MNLLITSHQPENLISIPIQFLFWGFVAAYILHILEESVLGEVFVDKVKNNFWPDYSWKKFFGFNTILLSLNIAAILLYENLGGAWLIFPLSLACERFLNGLWHFFETIITKKFSSGLLSGVLFWILGYHIIRYSIIKGEIAVSYYLISVILGCILTALMFGLMILMGKRKTE